jgi:protein-S-isoprenylcysteine O-methyltransferase Ste14
MSNLFLKAVIAFLVLPGTVAFAVPWWLLRPRAPTNFATLGALVIAIGVGILLWCVRDFYVAGRGTLAPWAPPESLVVNGLYRWSRNPMYIGVLIVLWGWALGFRSGALALYALLVMLSFHLRVVLGEEPWLARRHGGQWEHYKIAVPRWFGPL